MNTLMRIWLECAGASLGIAIVVSIAVPAFRPNCFAFWGVASGTALIITLICRGVSE